MTSTHWRAHHTVLALVATVAIVAACDGGTRDYDFRVSFEDESTGAAARAVVARIRTGGCDGAPRISETFARDAAPAMSLGALPADSYGFEAEAFDESCSVIARGCVAFDVPDADSQVTLVLPTVTGSPACSATRCSDGVCGEEVPMDGGPPDGGGDGGSSSDGGDASDAGQEPDAGPSIAAPRIVAPWNGVSTGSANADLGATGPVDHPLLPEVRWEAVAGAESYVLEMAPCSGVDVGSCDLSSPPVRVVTAGDMLRARPASALAVSETAPLGARYGFRVGACEDVAGTRCVFSDPRYLNVGRIAQDVDGDGDGDLYVVSRDGSGTTALHEIVSFDSSGAVVDAPVTFDSIRAISWIGDYDGDGVGELAIATNRGATGSEILYIDALAEAGALTETTSTDLGDRVVGIGDVNGDGYADFAASVRSRDEVRVQFGGPTFDAADNAILRAGPGLQDFGFELAAVGDQNGDGLADLAVGSRIAMDQARFDVYSFAASPRVVAMTTIATGETGLSGVPPPVAAAGGMDMDDDGIPEMAFGRRLVDSITVIFAESQQTSESEADSSYGWSLGIGDVDGTGRARLISGMPDRPAAFGDSISGATSVTVFTAGAFEVLINPYFTPDDARAGVEVTVVDLDGDGLDDFFTRAQNGFFIDRQAFDTEVGGIAGGRFVFRPSGRPWSTMTR